MFPDHLTLLSALLDRNVEFVIVGGVAVIAHGYIRTTRDLDIFIRPTMENCEAAYAALAAANVSLEGWEPSDLLSDEEHLRFATDVDHVDILSSIGEMSFEQVWRSRVDVRFGGLIVPFISKADLIENKIATGRRRDLSDVEELEQIPSKIE